MKKAAGIFRFLLNPHFLFCFAFAWMITNGWAYLLFLLGTLLQSTGLCALSGTYLALLWLPFTPEKILTLAIAVRLLRTFFPKDRKTLSELLSLHAEAAEKSL